MKYAKGKSKRSHATVNELASYSGVDDPRIFRFEQEVNLADILSKGVSTSNSSVIIFMVNYKDQTEEVV